MPASGQLQVVGIAEMLECRYGDGGLYVSGRCMEHSFWHERWESQQIGFHEGEPNRLLREHVHCLGPHTEGQVLVPLCGKAEDMAWLRERGYDIVGCDLSPIAIEAFIEEHGIDAKQVDQVRQSCWEADGYRLLCGDFFTLRKDDVVRCHAIYDRAALIALPADMRMQYAAKLRELLRAGARHLLITLEYPQHEMEGPPFSVGVDQVHALFGLHADITHLSSHDRLDEELRFRERGVSQLFEHAFCLIWK